MSVVFASKPCGHTTKALNYSETFRQPQHPVFFQKYCRTNGGRTAVQMGGVLQCKWEVYCWVSLSLKLRSQEVRRYKWGAYCCTNWRCTAVLFRQVVGVGVSETLPNHWSPGKCGIPPPPLSPRFWPQGILEGEGGRGLVGHPTAICDRRAAIHPYGAL